MNTFFIFLFTLAFLSCNTNEPNNYGSSIKLNMVDVSVTEAYLNLHLENTANNIKVIIQRDGKYLTSFTPASADTIITDTALTQNTTYSYKAILQYGNIPVTGSNEVIVKTLLPTSHDYNWWIYTFGGEAGSCELSDVAIIDENNIWAVGDIRIRDSVNQPAPTYYNAAHWDGVNWKLYKLQFYTFCGQTKTDSYPAKSIFAFDENNLAVSSTSQLAFVKEKNQIKTECVPVSVNKIWGINNNNLYLVGSLGKIAHYKNNTWQKIESGTTTQINDVWGVTEPWTSNYKVFCAVSYVFDIGDYKILTIDENDKVDSLEWHTGRRVHSVWTNKGFPVYTSGGGIFENSKGYWKETQEVPLYYTEKIRGTALNNIFTVGDFGIFAHYNGKDWHVYDDLYMNGLYLSLDVKENIVSAVGINGNKAIAVIGKRR